MMDEGFEGLEEGTMVAVGYERSGTAGTTKGCYTMSHDGIGLEEREKEED